MLFTCQQYDRDSLHIPNQDNMGVFRVKDKGQNWNDEAIDVKAKVKGMVIKENQKNVNKKKFKKYT
jgi:hypothetical protein